MRPLLCDSLSVELAASLALRLFSFVVLSSLVEVIVVKLVLRLYIHALLICSNFVPVIL